MERIQSAIAKARAAREGRKDPDAAPPAAAAPDLTAIWAALPEFKPKPRRLEASRIVAHEPGPSAAPYDLMRANLLKHLHEHDWTRVAITSPGSGCGKTTVCLNLALSLARQTERRVLLLEMDLRRPSIVRHLGLSGKHSFADVLAGKQSQDSGLIRLGPNLALGANSEPVPNPAELLSSTQAAAMIDAIEERFKPDVILCDLPPVLASDDTIAFLGQVDCALMIVEAEESTVSDIDRAGKALAGSTKVLGVVLNKCRYLDRTEGYGYGDS